MLIATVVERAYGKKTQRNLLAHGPRKNWNQIIGASLSKPHTSESNSAPVSIYIYIYKFVWYVRLTEYVYKTLFLRKRVTLQAMLITCVLCKKPRLAA